MDRILFINACTGPGSRTLALAQTLLQKLGGEVRELRLQEKPLPGLDAKGLEKRHAAGLRMDFSDPIFDEAKTFAQADVIVVAAPYWDLMFPAVLKCYWEQVTVSGLTFCYSPQGRPEGRCRAKQLHYVTTAGGFIGDNDFGFSYVKALAQGFFGIPEVFRYTAEGLDLVGADPEAILNEAKKAILRP